MGETPPAGGFLKEELRRASVARDHYCERAPRVLDAGVEERDHRNVQRPLDDFAHALGADLCALRLHGDREWFVRARPAHPEAAQTE